MLEARGGRQIGSFCICAALNTIVGDKSGVHCLTWRRRELFCMRPMIDRIRSRI